MASRQEIQKTVDSQKETIERYEKKLKDVIKAYKGVVAEKTALEESLQALSTATPTASGNLTSASGETEATIVETSVDQRVSVLQKSLATISQEKKAVESALTADRKNLLGRIDDLTDQLAKQQSEAQKQREILVQQVNEVRANLRQLQCERECEQSDHAAMIKELQLKLSHDRINSDHHHQQTQNVVREMEELKTVVLAKDKLIGELNGALERSKSRLSEVESKLSGIPTVQSLQMQLAQMRFASEEAMVRERRKLSELDEERRKLAGSGESRLSELERKVAELSALAGQLEQQHQADTLVIEELRQKLLHLNTENTNLARMTHDDDLAGRIRSVLESGEPLATVGKNFVSQLRQKWPSASLYDVFGLESPESEESHSRCQADLAKVKEEFERYKLKAQSILKNKSAKDGSGGSREVEDLKMAVAGLQARLEDLRKEKADGESSSERTIAELRQSIAEMRIRHQKLMDEVEGSRRQQIAELESEMQKQRDRTVALLADKDSEINCLKIMAGRSENQELMGGRLSASPVSELQFGRNRSVDRSESNGSIVTINKRYSRHSTDNSERFDLAQLSGIVARGASPISLDSAAIDASGASLPPPDPGNTPTLYLSQELARKERQLELLGRAKRELELSLREVQHSAVTKELQLFATVESLKETIRSLEAQLSRQSHNGDGSQMEYLKNVLVSYMLCAKLDAKQHMLKAIGATLKLTPKEMEQIQTHNATWYTWLRAK